MKKHILPLLIILVLSFWSWKPLLSKEYFTMHDDTQVARVIEMGRALREGQFPVRIVGDLGYGYGYPLFNFYGPLPYYVGGFLYQIGVDAVVATKIMFGIGIIVAPMLMYLALSTQIGTLGAVVAAIFYLYAPYHSVQIYARGAVGEYWAYGLMPLILWGFNLLKTKTYKTGIIMSGIGLAAVIVSHTVLGYVTLLLVLVYWIFLILFGNRFKSDHREALYLSIILILGLSISAFFWLPAIIEMGYTNVAAQIGPTADFRNHFVCLSQLWDSPWGYGGSIPGCIDGLSFKLGKLAIMSAALSLIIWLSGKPRIHKHSDLMIIGSALSVISLFMLLPFSLILWEIIPRLAYVQYPWRFLAYLAFGLSIMTGYIFIFIKGRYFRYITAIVLVGILFYTNVKLFVPQYFVSGDSAVYESDPDLKYRVSKISDEYLPPDFVKPADPSLIAESIIGNVPKATVRIIFLRANSNRIDINSDILQEIKINRIYFPGWHYYINGKEVRPRLANSIPYLTIKPGENIIEMKFQDTIIRKIANCISVITIIILIIIYGKKTIA